MTRKLTQENLFVGKRGFTLIELLVVISIIGMLSSVILVSLNGARQKGQIGAGLTFASHNYQVFGADAFAAWNFNEAQGSPFADSSVNNFTLTKTPPISFLSDSPTGSGGSLSSNMIITPNGAKNICNAVSGSTCNGYASSVWVKPAESLPLNTDVYFFKAYNESSSNNTAIAMMATDNSIKCGNPNETAVSFPYRLVVDQWQQVTCSYDQSTAPGQMSLYINGKLISKTTVSNFSGNIYNLSIGITNIATLSPDGTLTQKFIGKIDDLVIYSQPIK